MLMLISQVFIWNIPDELVEPGYEVYNVIYLLQAFESKKKKKKWWCGHVLYNELLLLISRIYRRNRGTLSYA